MFIRLSFKKWSTKTHIIMCSWFFHASLKCISLHLLKDWEWILFFCPLLNHKGKSKFLLDGSKCDQEEVSKNQILLLELIFFLFCVQQKKISGFSQCVDNFFGIVFQNFVLLKYKFEKSALKFYYNFLTILKNTSKFWREKKTHVWVPWDENDQHNFYILIVLLMHFITYLHALISLLNYWDPNIHSFFS